MQAQIIRPVNLAHPSPAQSAHDAIAIEQHGAGCKAWLFIELIAWRPVERFHRRRCLGRWGRLERPALLDGYSRQRSPAPGTKGASRGQLTLAFRASSHGGGNIRVPRGLRNPEQRAMLRAAWGRITALTGQCHKERWTAPVAGQQEFCRAGFNPSNWLLLDKDGLKPVLPAVAWLRR
jgi:hypothetical protein